MSQTVIGLRKYSTGVKRRIFAPVIHRKEIAPGLCVITFEAAEIASSTLAGQFVNVLPEHGESDPMLRRPFSIYAVEDTKVSIIVQAVGRGTAIIAAKQPGDILDVIGPLGQSWNYGSEFESAVLIIGGVGVASMPLLTAALKARGKSVVTYYGARTSSLIAREGLEKIRISTDDGSEGFRGSNIENLELALAASEFQNPKLFVCGPTGMMRAAKELAAAFEIPCEVSLETEMACGMGICQGCPVENEESAQERLGRKFRLVCTDGPSFEASTIKV